MTLIESWYGPAEVRGGKTFLTCLLVSGRIPRSPAPSTYLVLPFAVDVPGMMVVMTSRVAPKLRNGRHKAGPPEFAIKVSYDPGPGEGRWRKTLSGHWPVRCVPIRRRSVWQILRR